MNSVSLPNLYVGFDMRMPDAYMVAVRSARDVTSFPLNIKPLLLPHLRACRAYSRTTSTKAGVMWDDISAAPMSTQFAISRFLIPVMQGFKGESIFCDSDFLFRTDLFELLRETSRNYAVCVVKHQYVPDETVKMDGQVQTQYHRKNWSSFIWFNNEHPSNKWLTVENVNATPGRDLHAFCWLKDEEIGELDHSWNWLEGHSSLEIDPKAVHFTRGTPDMPGYENAPYADEWREVLRGL